MYYCLSLYLATHNCSLHISFLKTQISGQKIFSVMLQVGTAVVQSPATTVRAVLCLLTDVEFPQFHHELTHLQCFILIILELEGPMFR